MDCYGRSHMMSATKGGGPDFWLISLLIISLQGGERCLARLYIKVFPKEHSIATRSEYAINSLCSELFLQKESDI